MLGQVFGDKPGHAIISPSRFRPYNNLHHLAFIVWGCKKFDRNENCEKKEETHK
jgi:hypothetical protein